MNQNETEQNSPLKEAVVPTEGEMALNIVDSLESQIIDTKEKINQAIEKLTKNLEQAKNNQLALSAQEALIKAIKQEFTKSFTKN